MIRGCTLSATSAVSSKDYATSAAERFFSLPSGGALRPVSQPATQPPNSDIIKTLSKSAHCLSARAASMRRRVSSSKRHRHGRVGGSLFTPDSYPCFGSARKEATISNRPSFRRITEVSTSPSLRRGWSEISGSVLQSPLTFDTVHYCT